MAAPRWRVWVDIGAALAVIITGLVAYSEWHQNQISKLSDTEHSAIVLSITSESEARKSMDDQLIKAVSDLVVVSQEQNKSISLLVGEVKIILHKLDLGGGG